MSDTPPEFPPNDYNPPLGGATQPNGAPDAAAAPDGPVSPGSGGDARWPWVLAGAGAVLAALLLAIGAAVLLEGGSGEESAATTSTSTTTLGTSTTSPSSTTEPTSTTDESGTGATTTTESSPGTTVDEAETMAQIDDIIAFVEKERGLKFKTKPKVRFADSKEFSDLLLKDFEDDEEDMAKSTVTFRALGLIDPDEDFAEALRGVLDVGVVGFYDPETKELVVKGTSLSAYARTVVAHELTHALDDQHFDLNRPELDDATDETGYGFTVLVEGSASNVEQAYRDSMSTADQRAATAEETQVGNDPRLFELPIDLIKLISGPYEQGPELVDAILGDGGQTALDASFDKPPISSEQALSPEKYLDHETVKKVAKPDFDGEEVESGSLGQFTLSVMVQQPYDIDLVDPNPATVGWAGDHYVAFKGDRGDCVAFDVAMDDAASAATLFGALNDWAETMPDAEVTQEGADVTALSCIAPSGGGGGGSDA